MHLSTLLVTSLAIAPLAAVASQEPAVINPGDRVRVTAPSVLGGPFAGTVLTRDPDSLVVQGGTETRRLPLASITRLDLSRGRKSHTLLGAGVGFLVGAGVGGALFASDPYSCDEVHSACIVLGAVALGAAGALVGAVTGALVRTERWAEVPLERLRLSLIPDGGRALTLRVSLNF
jgi:hypothetical protein